MTVKSIIILFVFFFVPTSLLGGACQLFEVFLQSTILGLVLEIVIIPTCLAIGGNLFIIHNNIVKLQLKLPVFLLSGLAVIHELHMILSLEVWQHALRQPTSLDGISEAIITGMILLSLAVLTISYLLSKPILVDIKNRRRKAID